MEKIYNLFKFIEDKYPEYKTPIELKILNGIPLTKKELNSKANIIIYDNHNLVSLPEGLSVNNLNLAFCIYLKSLPKGLTVGGYLDLNHCTALKALPEGLTVGGNLNLISCINLKSLPEGLSVNNVDLSECTSLKSLPKRLTVGGNLRLRNCVSLESLPNDLRVLGGLYLRNTKIISKYTEAEIREMCPRIRGNIYLN
jgi:hypothetical protein